MPADNELTHFENQGVVPKTLLFSFTGRGNAHLGGHLRATPFKSISRRPLLWRENEHRFCQESAVVARRGRKGMRTVP